MYKKYNPQELILLNNVTKVYKVALLEKFTLFIFQK